MVYVNRSDRVRIAVDAMGGDNAPLEIVHGAVKAARELDVKILLTGDKNAIDEILCGMDYPKDKIEIVPTTEVIANDETPTVAVRNKKDFAVMKSRSLFIIRLRRMIQRNTKNHPAITNAA